MTSSLIFIDGQSENTFGTNARPPSCLLSIVVTAIFRRAESLSEQCLQTEDHLVEHRDAEGGKQVSIAIREHPNVSVRTADAPRLIGSATLIAEVEQEGIVSAWASSDPSATGPNQVWGKTDQPIIAGTTSAETVGKKCGPASLRPTVLNLGDLEIPIQNDLNGPLNTFGTRFWSLLCSKHVATEKLLTLGSIAVTRIGD